MRAYGSHLAFLIAVRRRVFGQGGKAKWENDAEFVHGMELQVRKWRRCLIIAGYSETQAAVIMHVTERGPDFWGGLTTKAGVVEIINDEYATVKSLLHGRSRREMRVNQNKMVRYREDMRRAGRVGYVIRSIMGEGKVGYDLQEVKDESGDIIVDAEDIHRRVTEFFRDWFKRAVGSDRVQVQEEGDFTDIIQNKERFVDELEHTGVPKWLRELVWEAIAYKAPEGLQRQMADALQACPSRDEFKWATRFMKKKSAPGFTGLTYNMIGAWPEETLDYVYDCLAETWEEKSTPDWWKWRWLVPIPKQSESTPELTQLRPLMLVEPLRKVWMRLVMDRITAVWRELGVMSTMQHGSTKMRGTDTASVQLISMMEQVLADGEELHFSSWDKKRAFDSLSKKVLVLGWMRGGVPRQLAEWIVSMDVGGVTVVRSPAAEQIAGDSVEELDQRGREEEERIQGFSPERGVAQGDVISPTSWGSVFDILCRMFQLVATMEVEVDMGSETEVKMEKVKMEELLLSGGLGRMYAAEELVYVDDSLSPAKTEQMLRVKASVVSAFCIVFGVQLSENKIRSMTVGDAKGAGDVMVYKYGWVKSIVKSGGGKPLKYLGAMYEKTFSGVADRDKATQLLQKASAVILKTCSSAESKMTVMKTSTIPKVTYACKMGAGTEENFKKAQTVLAAFHRKVAKHMVSAPAALLYMPKKETGLGFASLGDALQLEKWGMVVRGLRSEGKTELAMQANLEMALQSVHERVGAGVRVVLHQGKGSKQPWISSLLGWGEKGNLWLCRGGVEACGREESLRGQEGFEEIKLLGYCVRGDFQSMTNGVAEWNVRKEVEILSPKLREWLGVAAAVPQRIAKGQFWRLGCRKERTTDKSEKGNHVAEIMGWDAGGTVYYRDWSAQMDKGGKMTIFRHKVQVLKSSAGELFKNGVWRTIVEVTAPSTGREEKRRVFAEHEDIAPSFAVQKTKGGWQEQYRGWLQEPADVFVDGSWVPHSGNLVDKLMKGDIDTVGQGSAAVVVMPRGDDWWTRVKVVRLVDGATAGVRTSHGMEFFANAVGCGISAEWDNRTEEEKEDADLDGREEESVFETRAVVHTDCQAVQKTLAKGAQRVRKGMAEYRLLSESILQCQEEYGVPAVEWVKAHPERRTQEVAEWTREEWGIWLADRAAADDWSALEEMGVECEMIEVDVKTVHKGLVGQDKWYWGAEDGSPGGFGSLLEEVSAGRVQEYVKQRDSYQPEGAVKYWVDNTMGFVAMLFEMTEGTIAQRAAYQRIIWDKTQHGGNLRKGVADAEEAEAAGTCVLCNGVDSQQHYLCECSHPSMQEVRAETREWLLEHKEGESKEVGRLIDFVLQELVGPEGRRVCIGNWSESLFAKLRATMGVITMTLKDLLSMYTIVRDGTITALGGPEGVGEDGSC